MAKKLLYSCTCDICGFEDLSNEDKLPSSWVNIAGKLHLCDDCSKDFVKFLTDGGCSQDSVKLWMNL